MTQTTDLNPADCNCLAMRQAARHVSQYYDQHLAQAGLRGTQYSILARLGRMGPLSINALAAMLVLDRTTLGRNILPLQREGLIEAKPDLQDRRSKALHLTAAGTARLRKAAQCWQQAQHGFEAAFGSERAARMRGLMRNVVATELEAAPAPG